MTAFHGALTACVWKKPDGKKGGLAIQGRPDAISPSRHHVRAHAVSSASSEATESARKSPKAHSSGDP